MIQTNLVGAACDVMYRDADGKEYDDSDPVVERAKIVGVYIAPNGPAFLILNKEGTIAPVTRHAIVKVYGV